MSLNRSRKQLRNTSRMNIFVMLLMLFVVSGHCSAAMAMTPSMPVVEEVSSDHSHHSGHHDEASATTDHHSDPDSSCCDNHGSNTSTTFQSKPFKHLKAKQDDPKPLVAAMSVLPPSRAGPCRYSPAPHSSEFVTTPLYYSLCVLRL